MTSKKTLESKISKILIYLKVFYREARYACSLRRNVRSNFLKVQRAINSWHQIIGIKNNSNIDLNLKVMFVTGYGLGSHYLAIEPIIWAAMAACSIWMLLQRQKKVLTFLRFVNQSLMFTIHC